MSESPWIGAVPDEPPRTYPGWVQPQPQTQQSGMAIASMVLGLVGIFTSLFVFGIPSILAVIFGHIGYAQTGRPNVSGRGMALAGMITGYLTIGLLLLVVGILVATV